MKYALLFKENTEPILVSAEEVKNGLYNRDSEFVDPEYEFKVQFVRGSRNNGSPYFRLYYSYEEYKSLFPDRASRYEIVANMRRYDESMWHKEWKEKLSTFCSIEKHIKNTSTNKWKFADAFYDQTQTCIEFQHSYIALDFEERNAFYSKISINTIWLYDLSGAGVRTDEYGNIEILEDNAKGFFRISENPDNLRNHLVYIQVNSGIIYRVRELFRKDSSNNLKATVRYFCPTEIYTEKEFIEAIRTNTVGDLLETDIKIPQSLQNLWKDNYSWIIAKNIENNEMIFINHNGNGEMFRDFRSNCIKFKYADNKYGDIPTEQKNEYHLSHKDENRPIWVLVNAKKKA